MLTENQQKAPRKWLPLLLFTALAVGIWLGKYFFSESKVAFSFRGNNSYDEVFNLLEQHYFDTLNSNQLNQSGIEGMLSNLDPFSAYIPAVDLAEVNEPLEGNFEGIGVEFFLLNDTISVVNVINGGPSEKVGIKAGDKIIMVDGNLISKKGITNEKVINRLRGKEGTEVKVGIHRAGISQLLPFTITRGEIPLYSIDISYMINPNTGYIKINKFSATTGEELVKALKALKNSGMTQLILDLRGNGGGYLDAAIQVADEFLDKGKIITYTKGRTHPQQTFKASDYGLFQNGKLAVLIDEGSASASEIVAGALQDWDRATIIGRRSFGKGLVQEQFSLADGSAVRLTISRYYTPTGRCIQKPFKNDESQAEAKARFLHGEYFSKDSIKVDSTQMFTTPKGKKVFGGGGILPDVFIPADSNFSSPDLILLAQSGLLINFSYQYADNNRSLFLKQGYEKVIATTNLNLEALKTYVAKDPDLKSLTIKPTIKEYSFLNIYFKAYIARQLFGSKAFFETLNKDDKAIIAAIKAF